MLPSSAITQSCRSQAAVGYRSSLQFIRVQLLCLIYLFSPGLVSALPPQMPASRHQADTGSALTFALPSVPALYRLDPADAASTGILHLAGVAEGYYLREEYRLAAQNYAAAYSLAEQESKPEYIAKLAHNLCLCHAYTLDIWAFFTYCDEAIAKWSVLSDQAGIATTLISMDNTTTAAYVR